MNSKNETAFDYVFKYILIGDGNCGKTSILYQYVHGKGIFKTIVEKQNVSQTIGVEFTTKMMNFKQKSIKLQLWDTAGQERYRSITKTYYRGALGAIILFDLTNPNSFDALGQWIKDARDCAKPTIQIIIAGNKVDLDEERGISEQQARQFCQENDVMYIETSAKSGLNVNEAFQQLTDKILDLIESGNFNVESVKPRFLTSKSKEKEEGEQQQQQQCGC